MICWRRVAVTELIRHLEALRSVGGSVLLSQEQGCSPLSMHVLDRIREAGVPIAVSPDVHPDVVRLGGTTDLMSAAYVGAADLARDLIERGADLDSQDEEGFSPLMYAANAGQDELAQVLIEAGADVNQVDHAGSTPLMFVAGSP